jgi:uncharacterized protein YdeI (YjbR/CyaY-like superfamily)
MWTTDCRDLDIRCARGDDMIPATPMPDDKPTVSFTDQKKWRAWLARHHATSMGVWLRLAKRASGAKSLSYAEAIDVALCYGWIDGQAKRADEGYWLQKFTPRTRRSMWSKRNREKAAALIAAGAMAPAGHAEIERAKADGRWDAAYDSPRDAVVPADLQSALNGNARAKRFFGTLDRQNRFAILFRIQTARKPETRARRITQFVAMLARREKIYR